MGYIFILFVCDLSHDIITNAKGRKKNKIKEKRLTAY